MNDCHLFDTCSMEDTRVPLGHLRIPRSAIYNHKMGMSTLLDFLRMAQQAIPRNLSRCAPIYPVRSPGAAKHLVSTRQRLCNDLVRSS